MHILFLSDNFPPETNAPASRTYEHAKRWVAAGHRVTVITGAPNFPSGKVHEGYRNEIWRRHTVDGIQVIRVWTFITANEGFVRRTLDYMSFMVTATLASLFAGRADVVVATSPQFFTPCAAWVVSLLRRRPFIFELRDLWPDSIVAVGAMRETAVIRLLRKLEYFLYRRADRIVVVTESFRTVLTGNGIDQGKISVVPNGVDLDAYRPGIKPGELADQWHVSGKFVAAYVGTIGMAHGLDTILDAAARLKDRTDVAFMLIGEGAERSTLEQRCRDLGLGNVIFTGPVSKEQVREYWKLCDVALVLLRDSPLFAHVIPSKMFEAMGMERPIILGVRGESATLLERACAGIVIAPEDAAALAQAVRILAQDKAAARRYGTAGRYFASTEYNRDLLAQRMLTVLEGAASA